MRAAEVVAQVAAALDAAHAAGLVHRDVKPANVLIAGDDHAYLGDFGLTRLLSSEEQLTETGQWLGTTDFSSPEQLQGQRIDARADIYSLGCVLHAALFGKPPYPRATMPATLLAHLQDPIPRPSESGAPTRLRPRDGARARQGAAGPLPVGGRPRARGAGRRARRVGHRVGAQRRRSARPRRSRTPTGTPRPPTAITLAEHAAHAGAGGGDDGAAAARRRRRAAGRRGARGRRGRRGGRAARAARRHARATAARGRRCPPTRCATSPRTSPRPTRPRTARRSGALLTPRRAARAAERGRARAHARGAGVPLAVPRAGHAALRARRPRGRRPAGRAARAAATASSASDGDPIEGRIVLGMVRDRGEPRIGLIAVTPRG